MLMKQQEGSSHLSVGLWRGWRCVNDGSRSPVRYTHGLFEVVSESHWNDGIQREGKSVAARSEQNT